jgi:hypothetical protein
MYPEIPVSFTPRHLQPHGKGALRYPVGDSVGPTVSTDGVQNGKKSLPLPVLDHHFPSHPGVQFGQYTTVQQLKKI